LEAPLSRGPQPLHAGKDPEWVSKTDVIRYSRCPYTFWLIDQGELKLEETLPPQVLELIEVGERFHSAVERQAEPLEITPEAVPTLFDQDMSLYGVPTMYNPALRLYGRPDGIRTAGGALFPIEIKSHAAIQRSDLLELAFYWLLLEPFRTVHNVEPTGYLVFRQDDEPAEYDFPIAERHIAEVQRLIAKVRFARKEGVKPRICNCRVCSHLRREEVEAAVARRKDVSLLFNVGPCYSEVLDELGINTYEQLVAADRFEVADAMRERKYYAANAVEIDRWKAHAQSWMTGEPVCIGEADWPFGDSFMALDLEYASHIWCIGVIVVSDGVAQSYQRLWADSDEEEAESLRALGHLLAQHGDLPVLTWAGDGADIPALAKACYRHELFGLWDEICIRHYDLFDFVRRYVRLPIVGLSLGHVADYFGVSGTSPIQDGWEALSVYGQYLREEGTDVKRRLRDDLIAYNRDDVEALGEVAVRIRGIVESWNAAA